MKRRKRSKAVLELQRRNQKLQKQNAELRKQMSERMDKEKVVELAGLIFTFKNISPDDAIKAALDFKESHDNFMAPEQAEEAPNDRP